jgi:protein involved in polysaccharide export with SLBB domain
VTIDATFLSRWLWRLCVLALACLCSCGSYEDKRIRELLNEKGFGSRAHGDAGRENYIGGQDFIQFLIPPQTLQAPGNERLAELAVAGGQPVAIDGTIFVPYVGPVYALGHTEAEIAELVRAQLRTVLVPDIDLQARIIISQKIYYAFGEVSRKGIQQLPTDFTLQDALFTVGWTNLANLGRVYLIRPDAEHPLVIDINFRELLMTGNTTPNFLIHERDSIYVPPTFLGTVARLLQRLLEPLSLAVRTVIGAAQVESSYRILSGENVNNPFLFRF